MGIALAYRHGLSSSSRMLCAARSNRFLLDGQTGEDHGADGQRDQVEQPEGLGESDQRVVIEIHGAYSPAAAACSVRRIGQPAEDLQIGHQRVHLGDRARHAVERSDLRRLAVALRHAARTVGGRLRVGVGGGVGDHLVRVGHAHPTLRLEMQAQIVDLERGAAEPGVGRHLRFGHDVARIDQMRDMPLVRILVADPRQIRAGPLRSPEHRVVVLGFDRERVGTVALDLVAQRADHLRVAGIAAFADVDVAPGELERRVDPHVRRVLDRLVDGEQRRDLDEAADAGHDDDGDREPDRVAFQPVVGAEHDVLTPPGSSAPPASAGTGSSLVLVLQGHRCRADGHPDVVEADDRRRSGRAARRSRARRSRDAWRPGSR